MRILLEDPRRIRQCSRARIERIAERALKRVRGAAFARRAQVSLIFAGKARMRRLNRDYRGKDRVTDVLSFPQAEGPRFPLPRTAPRVLGDVVICTEVAARQARARGVPPGDEIEWLFVHGLLHLLGFDHAGRVQEKRMLDLQSSILGTGHAGRKG